jgi:hypothetical protein
MNMSLRAAVCALTLMLAGCSNPPPQKKAEEKPPEPVTGRYALYQMYQMGRSIGPNVEVLRLNSIHLPAVKTERGKAAAWQVMFVSPARGKARGYTYSVIEAEGNLHKGSFAGLEETWTGPRGPVRTFVLAAVKVDTDEAYKTALKYAAEYEKKNPDKNVSFLLEGNTRFGNPSWRVIWGESVGTSNFSVFVDASTGEYLQTMR